MADESNDFWKLVLVGGGGAAFTAIANGCYQYYKTWADRTDKNTEVNHRLRKEGYDAVIASQDEQIKELQADRDEDKKELAELRKAESDCRVQQAEIRGELKLALSQIAELQQKVRTLEGDSKVRNTRTIVQPGAVLIDARDSGVNLDGMTEEQKAKAEERIERRKPT